MGWYRDSNTERKWAGSDNAGGQNLWTPQTVNKPSDDYISSSASSGSDFAGNMAGLLVSGSFDALSGIGRIVLYLATGGITLFFAITEFSNDFSWEVGNIIATVIACIIMSFIIGAVLVIPVLILDFLVIRPAIWIYRFFQK
jgi:hypothetical protein